MKREQGWPEKRMYAERSAVNAKCKNGVITLLCIRDMYGMYVCIGLGLL